MNTEDDVTIGSIWSYKSCERPIFIIETINNVGQVKFAAITSFGIGLPHFFPRELFILYYELTIREIIE